MAALLITCEHAGNLVPPGLRRCFRGAGEALRSHRGWDIGALPIAERLSADHAAPLLLSLVTRLAVDLNRSPGSKTLLSEFTRDLPEEARRALIAAHYTPYRMAVEAHIAQAITTHGRAVHVSVHTFAPVMKGKTRALDIGLLFDPARPGERDICERWRERIRAADPSLRVRFNLPYRGTSDGFTTHLRTLHNNQRYAGIELEANQAITSTRTGAARLGALLSQTFPWRG